MRFNHTTLFIHLCSFTLLLSLVPSIGNSATDEKAYRGFADIQFSYGKLQVDLKLPLAALSADKKPQHPANNKPKDKLESLQGFFQDISKVVTLPKTAHCKLTGLEVSTTEPVALSANVDTQEEQLTLLKVNYSITCTTPRHLRQIGFALLSQHPKLKKLEVSLDSNGTKRESILDSNRRFLLLR